MKNNLFILFFITILASCSSDDSMNTPENSGTPDTPETPENPDTGGEDENNLVLKKITSGRDGTLVIHFDEKGRLSFSEDTGFSTPEKINEVTYTADGKKKKFTSFNGRGGINGTIEYFYDSEDKITRIVEEPGILIGFPSKSVIDLSYQNNIVKGIAFHDDIKKYELIFGFNNNTYEQLQKLEVFDASNKKIFEEVYEYSTNGNLIKNNVVIGEDQTNTSNSFDYDDKKNPYAEGNKEFYLNEILLLDRPNSLAFQLTSLSTNNLITSLTGNGNVTLEYNDKDYPTKETGPSNNGTPNIRTFEYY